MCTKISSYNLICLIFVIESVCMYIYLYYFISRVTCIHLAVASKWLYVGTEKGNIHVVNIDTFALSGYVINWNKAIEL